MPVDSSSGFQALMTRLAARVLVWICALAMGVGLPAWLSGCRERPRIDPSEIPPRTMQALLQLRAGMQAEEIVRLTAPVSLEWGRQYLGGSGASELFFQVSPDLQLRVPVEGAPGWRSSQAGTLEPKTPWARHDGDSIMVERPGTGHGLELDELRP